MASRDSSESGRPVRTTRARTCRAPMRPSPVEAWSRKMRWPDCSPPRLKPALAHGRHHVAVAHRGPVEADALRGQGALQPQVAHHRRHHGVAAQLAVALHAGGAHGHDRVAVHDLPLLVDDDDPVRVAVEGDADLGAALHHLGPGVVGVEGPRLAVDVHAVGTNADGPHLGPELGEDEGRDAVGGAVGRVHHHPDPVEGEVPGEGVLDEGHVAPAGVLELLGPADGRTRVPLSQPLRLAG